MAERVRKAWSAWKRLPFARKIRLFGFAVLLIAAVELVIVSSVYDQLLPFWQGFLINFGTDALGVAITVLVLNALQERAQEEQLKKQLIREMGSKIRDVAVPAAENLRARGWGFQEDTALVGALLYEANLQGALLYEANLQGALLYRANFQGAILVRANLQGASLEGANLQGTRLGGVDLQGASLVRAKLSGAIYSSETLWPDGFDPKVAGAVSYDELAEPPANTKEQGDG